MSEPGQANGLPRGSEVALVHDWLTGMRGGEKVLEEIAHLFPAAPVYTLFHFPGSVSKALESHPIHRASCSAPRGCAATTAATCRCSRSPSRTSTSAARSW